MPWDKLSEVPDSTKTHDGAGLTLKQANWAANAADNAEDADEPWAVAWSQFEKEFKKTEDGKSWVRQGSRKDVAHRAVVKRLAASDGMVVSYRLTATEVDELLWVEACMAFDFTDETDRHVEVTKRDLKDMLRNFDDDVVGRKIFMDIDHMAALISSDDPKSRGKVGTVEKMSLGVSKNPLTEGDPTLLCGVRLNKRGKELIEGEEFGYISIVFERKWKDRRPEHQDELVKGPVATSITLTNDPFAAWLAEVGEDLTDRIAASRTMIARVGKTGKVERFALTLDGESIEDLRNRLQGALHKTLGLSEEEYVWAEDIQIESETQGVVIYRHDGVVQGRGYTVGEDGTVTLDAESKEYRHPWVEAGAVDKDENDNGGNMPTEDKKVEELTRKAHEAETKLAEAQAESEKLKRTALKAEKATRKLHETTLLGAFKGIVTAMGRVRKNGKVMPPAIRKRYSALCKTVLTADPDEDEKKKEVLQEVKGAITEIEPEIKEAVETAIAVVEDIKAEPGISEELVEDAETLLEVAVELDQAADLGTVDLGTETVGASRKPANHDTYGDALAARVREILARKPDEVTALKRFAVGSAKRHGAAMTLAGKELKAEDITPESFEQ